MKTLNQIKFGERILPILVDVSPITYNSILRETGLSPKQVQKALSDLQKSGYIGKDDRGYWITDEGSKLVLGTDDGQETTTGL